MRVGVQGLPMKRRMSISLRKMARWAVDVVLLRRGVCCWYLVSCTAYPFQTCCAIEVWLVDLVGVATGEMET
ncbi:hypothetical protein FB192DRAFT_1365228 [Mucor lusitanicus]|uniref:Uncharacterized protein n=1 Tax=Mucor circinelloides f. lusitanicus TaxID=29924 RepID=A0A8H4F5Q9_MUCCL|nr:hypothetical protein FB192DRAFT_1365228 [Mucor lusitanicus]